MQEFLKDFTKRMKSVGRYAVLMNQSFQKKTWKQFGIESIDDQMNLLFTVLLYIMEYSLMEEDCTLDDISGFLREINDTYYRRDFNYEGREFADFLVNDILGNSGNIMDFSGYDYEKKEYRKIPISYVANQVVYQENGIRRTSYYLTEDGYNMVLSTMELENNLKLTVHEMLFKMHLEKADYGHAVNDIKNVFDQLRIQNQKIQEAMHRIRKNALAYSVEEYAQLIEENMGTVEETREKFRMHRESVEAKVQEFEEREFRSDKFNEKEKDSLENLKIIRGYLKRSMDEHQKILNEHFDLKSLYDRELENYSNMTMIQRYPFRSGIYDRVMDNVSLLENTDAFLRMLLWKPPKKIYHPNKALEAQRRIRKEELESELVELGFDEEEVLREREEFQKKRLEKYHGCLELILQYMKQEGKILLSGLKNLLTAEEHSRLFPTAEIFREIMIELLTAGVIDVAGLKKEQQEHFFETALEFQLNPMLLTILEERNWKGMEKIFVQKTDGEEKVLFEGILDENGNMRKIRCSDVAIWYE